MGEDELKLPLDEVKALESSWDDTPMPRPKPPNLRDTGETEFDFKMPGGPSRLIDKIADELGPARSSSRALPAPTPPPAPAPLRSPPPPPPPTPPVGLSPPTPTPPPPIASPSWASMVAPVAAAPAAPPPSSLRIFDAEPARSAAGPTPLRVSPPPPPPGPTPPPPPAYPPEWTPVSAPPPGYREVVDAAKDLALGLPAPAPGGPPTPALGLEGLIIGPPQPAPSPSPPPPPAPEEPVAMLKMPEQPLAPAVPPDRPTVLIDGQAAALDHAIASSFHTAEGGPAPRRGSAPPPVPPVSPALGVPAQGLDDQQLAKIVVGLPVPNATPVELRRIDLAADLKDLVPSSPRPASQRSAPAPSAPPRRSAPPPAPLPPTPGAATWWKPFALGVGLASVIWLLLRLLS